MDRLFFSGTAMMKPPRFTPDQLTLILVVGLVVAGLAAWRYFTMF
jgi:hypothetical protein